MNDCMLWARTTTKNGYAKVSVKENGKWVTRLLHRELYIVEVGEIPAGMVLDHLCRNRCCINMAHLEPVTLKENIRRGMRGPQATHCYRAGHPLLSDRTWQ